MKLNSKFEILKSALSKIYHKVQHSLYFTSVCLSLLVPLTNIANSKSTVHFCPLSTHQTKLPTFNLALLTKQDSCPTGHEADVWVLGNKGLNWKKGNPAIDSGFRFTPIFGEAYTSYCDKNGELLIFATNMRIYNKYAEVIENRSFFPFGGPSSFMNLLLPAPGSDSLFYIFYPDMASNGVDSFPHSLHYDLIDITANNGRGKFLSKENLLLSTSSERIEGIRNCNGRDWWVIAQNALTDSFHVWSLTSNGLIPTAQLYDSGNKNKENKYVIRGDLKASHSGAYLAEATIGLSMSYPWINSWNENSSLEVHRFDPSTGRIYDGIDIIVDSLVDFFSAEFSSDDRMIYSGHPMTQFDISSFDPSKISTSAFSFDNYYSYIPILGKNQELYLSNGAGPFNFWFSNYLGHVKYPRRRGYEAIFKDLYLNLGDSANINALPPHFAQSIRFPYKAYIQAAFLQCQDSILKIHLLDPCPHEDAEWSLIDGGEIVGYGQTRDTIFLRYSEENEYHIAVRYAAQCGFKTDTVDIRVKACDCTDKIDGIPIRDTSLCKGSDYELRFQSTYDYVKVNGRYFHPIDTIRLVNLVRDTFLQFRLFNFYDCDTVITQNIHIYNPSPPTFDTIHLCYGDSAWIDGRYYSAVSKVELKYKVSGGCDSVHTTFLDYSEEPTITFQNFYVCTGDSVEVNGKIFTRDTFFTYKYLNIDGCDSFVFKPRVIVYPTISPSQSTIFICKHDSIRIKQQWYKTGDQFSDTLQNNNGCDSIIQYNILPSKTDTTSVRHLLCTGDSILLLGKKWGDPQTLFEVLKSSRGCNDSLIMHDIRLLPTSTPTMREYYICNGDSIFINNQWIKSAQSIETKLKSFTGCDSILQDKIIIKPLFTRKIQFYICYGDSVQVLGALYDEEIQFDQRISSSNPALCDSLIEYQIIQYEDIYVDLPQSIEIEEGSAVTLTSSYSPNAKTFHWSPSLDLSCIDCPNPICTSSNDRVYYLEVSDENGCISTDSILVLVKKKSGEYFFPNAFSPNADGINDLWIPVASSAQLNLISLDIYSRWGGQVYSCTSSCKGWDGKLNDQAVNPGVYVYYMVFRDERGDRKELNGEFTLVR